ncbi:MAG: FHA domain-containing protein [Planctomycetota bacterium]
MSGRDGSDATGSSAPTPVLGTCQGGLCIQLVRCEGDAANPFVVLHEGRFSRVYLAEVRAGSEAPVAQFAWKVRSDASPARIPSYGRGLTNLDVDDLWQREIDGMRRVKSPHVVATTAVPEELLASRPIVYCKKVDRYFHPVSAESGLPLTVCRNDGLLADCGLVPYSQDTWRYLHDGDEAAASKTFYRVGGQNSERPRAGAVVRMGSQLFADWSRLVHAEPGSEAAKRAAPSLPCLSCEHRGSCYPKATAGASMPAEQHLHAVSFYDVSSVALELLDFDYDQVCDLLGGAEAADVAQGAGRSVASRRWLAQRAAALSGQGQWLFGGDAGRFPLEVLSQKLAAFREVCEGLRAVHALGRAHLAVAPTNVMGRLVGPASGTPVRWGFRVALIDLGSPVAAAPTGALEHAPRLSQSGLSQSGRLEPVLSQSARLDLGPELGMDANMRPFLAPFLQGQDGGSVVMSVSCQMVVDGDGRERLAIEAQGAGSLQRLYIGDVVCVQPTAGVSAGAPALSLHIVEMRGRGFVAGTPIADDHPCRSWLGKRFEARLTFFRTLGPSVDLFGLGMLLFRTVLVNDQHSIGDVAAAVARCVRRLEDEQPGNVFDEQPTVARLHQLVAGSDVRAFFDAANVLHKFAARDDYAAFAAERSAPIDPSIWRSLLLIAFKLVTQWQGFSYSHSHAETSPFLLRQLGADLEALRRRLHVDMFASEARTVAMEAACTELLEQLRTEMMSDSGSITTMAAVNVRGGGFRLVATREDDAGAPQEYEFDREQVTIGRREVESLVRLNDPMVSAMHALIELQPEGYVVIDRGSTNGTEVDGIRLPVEVAQPLQDGSVILIRPFLLVFHTRQVRRDTMAAVSAVDADTVVERLRIEYARCYQLPVPQQHEALRQILRKARETMGAAELHGKLDEVLGRLRGAPAGPTGQAAEQQAKLFMSAYRSLSQLSRTLLGPGDFQGVDDVRTFAGKLARFVETTTQWIERSLDLRRALGKHLDLGATGTASGRSPVRTAADVRQLVLGWSSPTSPSEPTTYFLAKFYDDYAAIVEGLLLGAQQVRRAVREQLDPVRLAELAAREAKFGLLVNAVANSSLWKLYVQTFQAVTAGQEFEAELDRILQKSLQDHRTTGQ